MYDHISKFVDNYIKEDSRVDVKIKRLELLTVIKENHLKHKTIFNEAMKGYANELEKVLSEKLEMVRAGSKIEKSIRLPEPEDHTGDYERIMKMLDMDVRETIELDERQFAEYVMDDWIWKQEWVANNSAYTAMVK
ncbi:hypothetical protein LCGC14_3033420 [marine sediment metagenome]|uniref:Uncharacterized protein n=1 Tax=marine sediment metagenome TaxID=412755 RepID=A0A0F8WS93_9ZZZZ